jgi:hypothetical protein
MYFCPRKNGPVEESLAFFSNSFKVEQFFSATKYRDPAPRLHQTPFSLILLKFGFKRNVVKENYFCGQ